MYLVCIGVSGYILYLIVRPRFWVPDKPKHLLKWKHEHTRTHTQVIRK